MTEQEVSSLPTAESAVIALRRIAKAWELDAFEVTALIAAPSDDFTSVEWSRDRLTRVRYLVELETALRDLNPKFGVAHWMRTRNPGPFFAGNSPWQMLTGSTSNVAELLRQVRRWSKR
ncbi:MAG TPA: hypothetical protein VMB34_02495 [Acetobacteraceae bacterium]|nr:hypothetical protein [Acetobacteraceae bacterium]